MPKIIKEFSLEEIEQVSQFILDSTNKRIFLFYADMGVGKTTLIKTLIRRLGVDDNITSPTFSLVNEYRNKDNSPIYHFDFYRIEDEEEAYDIGIEDYFYSDAYCFVEWPERIKNLLPLDAVVVHMTTLENDVRQLILENR